MKLRMQFTALAILFSTATITGAEGDAPHLMTCRIMKKPPLLDGVISPGEWRDACRTFGSRILNTEYLDPRKVSMYFGCTRNAVYFACVSELPPTKMKLLSRVRKRDGRVYADDAVEILLLPPKGGFVYQVIANSLNTFFDVKYAIVNGGVTPSKPEKWDPAVKAVSRKTGRNWTIEMSIPLADLGGKSISPEGEWKLQMTRDWKQPARWTCWNKTKVFCDPMRMGSVFVTESGPVTQFPGPGPDFYKGKVNCRLDIFNPASSLLEVSARIDITSITAPRVLDEKRNISPGSTSGFTLEFNDPTRADYECTIVAKAGTGPDKRIIFRDRFCWSPKPRSVWKSTERKRSFLDFSFYPYRRKVKVRLNSSRKNTNNAKVKFTIKAPDGTEVAAGSADLVANGATKTFLLPELTKGEYAISARVVKQGEDPVVFTKKFRYAEFPWQNNQLGMEDVIIPPFRPLATDREKRTIKALMTGYRIRNGFWDAVFAEGENILAGPVELIINDGALRLTEKKVEFIKISRTKVSVANLLTAEDLELDVAHEYDYDGMCKVEMTFRPQKKIPIRTMRLDIPLKKSVARLMHAVNNNMRYNPAGYVPDGKGVVWKSTMAKNNPRINGTFMPYFWLGDISRGLSWFTESDKGWSVDRKSPAIEVIRKGESVILRINVANLPFTLKKPFKLVMGFQPTPVKPRLKNWRRICEHWRPKGITHALKMDLFAGPQTYGVAKLGTPFPANRDYSILRKIAKKYRNTQENQETMKKEVADYVERNMAGLSSPLKKRMRQLIARGLGFSRNSDYAVPYLNPRGAHMDWDAYKVYMDEWWCSEFRANAADLYNITTTRSYQDMLLYYIKKLMESGFDGLYYDNIRDWPVFDPERGPAYHLQDGRTQPYFDIFSMRQLLKRTATLLYTMGRTFPDGRPVLTAHMTNTNIVPYMSFCSISLDLEAFFGATDFQERFSDGYLLTETLGTQTGCIPEVLIKITGSEKARVSRTFVSTCLAYDLTIALAAGGLDQKLWRRIKTRIMAFGYGTDKVRVYPCWKNQKYIKANTTKVKLCLYKKEDSIMTAVSDFGNGGEVKLDISGLNFKKPTAIDAETGNLLPVQNSIITLKIPRHDFKLLEIRSWFKSCRPKAIPLK